MLVNFCYSRRHAGILVLGTLNYFPVFHYAFYCDPSIRNVYIAMMTVSGCSVFIHLRCLLCANSVILAGIYLVCSPSYASPAYRRMRTYTFFALGFVVIFPFAHAAYKYGVCFCYSWFSNTIFASDETYRYRCSTSPKQFHSDGLP